MKPTTKYSHTPHLPFSPGLQNNDRMVENGWKSLLNHTLVLTEKMDGGNSMICHEGCYDRSHAVPTHNPWSRNLWDAGCLYDHIKNKLRNEYIYGENMYGIHSIEYPKLDSYFYMFGCRDDDYWYSWDDVNIMAVILELPTVPVLEIKKFESVEELHNRINYYMSKGSKYGPEIEGIVVRNIDSFHIEDFNKNVVKYVRKGHIQTDQFWQKIGRKLN